MRASLASEQGYILIAAIWLLILIGSVAALLLARSLTAAGTVAAEAAALRTKLAVDGAIETVAADLLINGSRSPFGMAPAAGIVEVSGRRVAVRISAESGKVDLNEADLALIERVLAGLSWEAAERALFVQQLRTRRAEGRPLRTPAELSSITARSRSGGGTDCLDDYFTIHSGRPEPDPVFASPELTRLFGRPSPGTESGARARASRPPGPASPIVIEANSEEGTSTQVIARLGGLLNQPVTVSSWGLNGRCGSRR